MDHEVTKDIRANERFEVRGTSFVTGFAQQPDDAFTLVKSAEMLERYQAVISRYPRPRLLELGIAFGGSVAWLSMVADPTLLVAIELSETPIERLSSFIADRGLAGVVRPHFGVDQADRERVRAIVAAEFGDDPIDVVVDDASHLYGPTLASFETLFPLVRPGGSYIIEDWKWENEVVLGILEAADDPTSPYHDQVMALADQDPTSRPPAETPCSRIAVELVLARAESAGAIAEVTVDEHWITVVRGERPLDADTFRLSDLCIDHFGLLAAPPD